MTISSPTPGVATLALRRTPTLLALAAVAALTACGGGDDPTAPVAAPPAPAPAAPATPTAPTITSAPQSLTVGEGASASFSVSGTSNAGALRYEWALNGGGTLAGVDTSSYTIAATSLVDDGKQLFARLLNDAGSSATPAATLTVTERQWATAAAPDPVMQTSASANGTLAAAIDSSGQTHLLYGHVQDNGSITLRGAQKPQGSATPLASEPVSLATLAPYHSVQDPRLVAGPDGKMLAVWREGLADEGGNVVKAALFTPGSGNGWRAIGTVSGDGAIDAGSPALARTGSHTFELVWREHDGSEWNVHARRLDISGSTPAWSPSQAVESVSGSATQPMIASDGAGNVIVTFSTLGAQVRAWANTRTADTVDWNAAAAQEFSGLSDAPAQVSHLTMNSHGRAVALFNADLTRVFARQYQFGGSSPGWQGAAAYVANRYDGLDAAVQPVTLLDDHSETRFSILSIHNNGMFVSRWPCTGGGCGAAQTFLNAGGGISDFAAGRDAAGNLIVVVAMGQDFGNATGTLAIRHHAALDSWRTPGHGGNAPAAGKLLLAVHPDGSASTLQTTQGPGRPLVRSADFR